MVTSGLGLGIRLFIIVPRPGDSEVTFAVFESSFHLLIPVQPLKGTGNSVKCFVHGHNKRTYRNIFALSLFYAVRQVGKL